MTIAIGSKPPDTSKSYIALIPLWHSYGDFLDEVIIKNNDK